MIFEKDIAKGHFISGSRPKSEGIYMNEMCRVCEKYLEDGKTILRSKYVEIHVNIVVCEECAYIIHCGYEASL